MNPASWIQRHGLQRPDAPAIAEGERIHATWAQLASRSPPSPADWSRTSLSRRAIESQSSCATGRHTSRPCMPCGTPACAPCRSTPGCTETRSATSSSTAAPLSSSRTTSTPRTSTTSRRRSTPCTRRSGRRARSGSGSPPPRRSPSPTHPRRPGLALLHERHHRPAEGSDAHPPQCPHGLAQLLRRHRPDRPAGQRAACRAVVPWRRPLRSAACRQGSRQRHPGERRGRPRRDRRAAAPLAGDDLLRRADDDQATCR